MTDFIAKISLRGDTAANWTSNNPTLDLNEWGIENDTAVTSSGIKFIRVKRGDGATTWNSLPYANFGEFDIGTQLADLYAYVDTAVVGLWDDRGNYDASSGAYPSTDGSGPSLSILKGDTWTISVAGTLPTGQVVEVGDTVRALIDSPGNTQANWAIMQNNIGYVPLNAANNLSDVPDKAAARSNLGIDKRTAVGDANYSMLPSDRYVVLTVPLTAPRTLTLPPATGVNPGQEFIVDDEIQGVSSTNTWTIGVPVGKKLNNVTDGTVVIQSAGSWRRFLHDGAGNYTYDADIVRQTQTQQLSNKDIVSRVVSVAPSATPTLDVTSGDIFKIVGLNTNITSINITGTPRSEQKIQLHITDDGTARSITHGSAFSNSGTLNLPGTTVASTKLRQGFEYNSATGKLEIIALI